MAVFIRVHDLLTNRDQPAGKLWGMTLLMSIRDLASSLHYHPWRVDGPLSYIVSNVRHVLRPPPNEWAESLITSARSLFFSRRGLLSRLFAATPKTRCQPFILMLGSREKAIEAKWDVVYWSSGRRSGLDFYRLNLSADELSTAPSESDAVIRGNELPPSQ